MKVAPLNEFNQSLFERIMECYTQAGLPSLNINNFGPAEHIQDALLERPYRYELTPNFFVADNKIIFGRRMDDDGYYIDVEIIPNDASYCQRHATRCYQLLRKSLYH